jgi:molecular chaperone DnaK
VTGVQTCALPIYKVSQTERADIEAKLNDLRSAIKDKNLDRIKKATEDLTKASHKLAEEVYKQSAGPQAGAGPGPEQPGPSSGGGQKKDDDVIDAEFREEKK